MVKLQIHYGVAYMYSDSYSFPFSCYSRCLLWLSHTYTFSLSHSLQYLSPSRYTLFFNSLSPWKSWILPVSSQCVCLHKRSALCAIVHIRLVFSLMHAHFCTHFIDKKYVFKYGRLCGRWYVCVCGFKIIWKNYFCRNIFIESHSNIHTTNTVLLCSPTFPSHTLHFSDAFSCTFFTPCLLVSLSCLMHCINMHFVCV